MIDILQKYLLFESRDIDDYEIVQDMDGIIKINMTVSVMPGSRTQFHNSKALVSFLTDIYELVEILEERIELLNAFHSQKFLNRLEKVVVDLQKNILIKS